MSRAPMTRPNRILTVSEVVALTEMPMTTIRSWCQKGWVSTQPTGLPRGRPRTWTTADVDAILAIRQAGRKPEPPPPGNGRLPLLPFQTFVRARVPEASFGQQLILGRDNLTNAWRRLQPRYETPADLWRAIRGYMRSDRLSIPIDFADDLVVAFGAHPCDVWDDYIERSLEWAEWNERPADVAS